MAEAIVFYGLAAVLVGMGLVAITRTNPLASALSMIGAFAALAALYALLSAPLNAVIQIFVYAGGITVLMVFVIMVLNLGPKDLDPLKVNGIRVSLALAGAAVVFSPVFLTVLPSGQWKTAALPDGFGGIASIGGKLFTDYLFPFEMLSLLLLAAVVGALVLSKRKL